MEDANVKRLKISCAGQIAVRRIPQYKERSGAASGQGYHAISSVGASTQLSV